MKTITATFNDIQVSFTNEAFLNATAIAKSFNKRPKDYLKTEQTQAYIKALAQNLTDRTKILTDINQLVTVKRGGKEQGTWLHPKLAVHFARWLSPEFAVWCDEQIEKILNHKDATSQHRKVFVSACTKLSVNNKLRSQVYTDVANHFGYEKPVDMPIDILPEAIAYVYEELLAQEKARKSKRKDDTNNAFWKEVGIRKIESNNGILNKLNGLINELKENQEFLSNSLAEQRYNLTVEKQQSINEQLNQAFCR